MRALEQLLGALDARRSGPAPFALLVRVGPPSGPSAWAGQDSLQTLRLLWRPLRHSLVQAAALVRVVRTLTGGRVPALPSVCWPGLRSPPQPLMAGLFG